MKQTKLFLRLLSLLLAIGGLTAPLDAQTQLGMDIDGEAAGDFSSYSVSFSADGNRVAIGAIGNNDNGFISGQVRVYAWDGSSWTQVGADINGEAAFDQSGFSVSLSADGNRVAIGANLSDGNGFNSGQVRVYAWDGSSWTQVGADIDGEEEEDESGFSVSLSADGNRVAIGAIRNNFDAGQVRVYAWDGSSWMQLGDDINGEAAGDQSGRSVSLSADGNRVAIGAYFNDGNGDAAGQVRVYEWDGSSWTQLGDDIDGEAAGDFSGWSVSLSADGKRVAIGAIENNGNSNASGHVRVYEWDGSSWTQVGADIDGEAAGDLSGYSVSLSADGNWVAIGAPFNDGNGGSSGHVRVYDLTISCQLAIIGTTTTPVSCQGSSDGALTITATGATNINFTIDGPGGMQTNTTGVFVDLMAGNFSVTVSDADLANCSVTQISTVSTAADTEDPMITACAGTTVNFNGEESFNSEDVIDFDATDNCGIASITFDPPLISCEDLGTTITVTITVTDVNGNPNFCTADVVVDGLPCGFMLTELGCEGDADYDVPTETFTLEATNCYYANPFNQDKITFVKTELCGDGEFIAHLDNVTPFGWAGIVMRETLNAGSKKVALSRDNGNFARREVRTATNGPAYPQQFPAHGKNWLRLVRTGNQFAGYVSPNGVQWQQVMVANLSMDQCIYVGLFLTNKQPNQTVTADFRNVEVNQGHSGTSLQQLPATSLATQPDVSVYPNPTAGMLTVDLGAMLDKDVQLELRNTNGQILRQLDLSRVSERRTELQLGDLPVGVYWLRVQTEGEAPITERIVVQRP